MDPDPSSPLGGFEAGDPIAGAAQAWVRRRETGLAPEERTQLRRWLAADPRHAAAFSRADAGRSALDWPLHAGMVDAVLAGLEQSANRRRGRRRIALSTTAGIAAVVVVLFTLFTPQPSGPAPSLPLAAPTLVVLEPRRQTLPDGSVVELRNDARIETHFTAAARLVTLTNGTACFQVTKDSRPFIVTAAGVTAQALGTVFSVELGGDDVSVLVTEGRVAVNKDQAPPRLTAVAPAPLAVIDAGKYVRVPLAELAATVPVATLPAHELRERLAWRVPLLEFNSTPLHEVIAMINRHNPEPLALGTPAAGEVKLSGLLRADRLDALLGMLEADFQIRAERRDGKIVLHR